MSKSKLSAAEREAILVERIAKAKAALNRLKNNRKQEIASLAIKHGLDVYENKVLDGLFARIAKELKNDHA